MRIMFDAISVTNETSYVPSSGVGGADGASGEENSELEREGQLPNSPNILPNTGKGQPHVPLRERRKRPLKMCV